MLLSFGEVLIRQPTQFWCNWLIHFDNPKPLKAGSSKTILLGGFNGKKKQQAFGLVIK